MSKPVAWIVVAAIIVTLSWPATAKPNLQPSCNTHEVMIGLLAEQYREKPIAIAILQDRRMIELLTTDNGSTWTLVVTNAVGWSCMFASGEWWQNPPPEDEDML